MNIIILISRRVKCCMTLNYVFFVEAGRGVALFIPRKGMWRQLQMAVISWGLRGSLKLRCIKSWPLTYNGRHPSALMSPRSSRVEVFSWTEGWWQRLYLDLGRHSWQRFYRSIEKWVINPITLITACSIYWVCSPQDFVQDYTWAGKLSSWFSSISQMTIFKTL